MFEVLSNKVGSRIKKFQRTTSAELLIHFPSLNNSLLTLNKLPEDTFILKIVQSSNICLKNPRLKKVLNELCSHVEESTVTFLTNHSSALEVFLFFPLKDETKTTLLKFIKNSSKRRNFTTLYRMRRRLKFEGVYKSIRQSRIANDSRDTDTKSGVRNIK